MQIINLLNEALFLLPQKAIWWEKENCLIISDTHFGKSGHFRKMGIAVPQPVFTEDMQRFVSLVAMYKPEQLVIVGDMFHSDHNKEADLFVRWRNDFSALQIHLVKGNHDIMPQGWYDEAAIKLHDQNIFQLSPFSFIHDLNELTEEQRKDRYFFSGHIHPAVSISGKARQHLRLPCFYFNNSYAVLPAFGKFTGYVSVRIKKEDRVYAISQQEIIPIQ